MKISVIITAYNDVATLAETINSVLGQSYKADEIIVVDDGSKDASSEVAKVYAEVSLLRQKHMGTFAARNNGVMMASNMWILFLDAKSTWKPDVLQQHVNFYRHTKNARVSVYENQTCISLEKALAKGRVHSSAVMLEKKLYDTLGGFDETFDVLEDDELWFRLLEIT